MRVRFGCMIILLVSMFCYASSAFAVPAKISGHSAKLAAAHSSVIDQNNHNQHCDQPEDTEVITASYTRYYGLDPIILMAYSGLRSAIYPASGVGFYAIADNTLIQPFYKLILFPFHGFW